MPEPCNSNPDGAEQGSSLTVAETLQKPMEELLGWADHPEDKFPDYYKKIWKSLDFNPIVTIIGFRPQ